MKRPFFALALLTLAALACSLFAPAQTPVSQPTVPPQEITTEPEAVPTATQPAPTGLPFNYENFSFNIPIGLANRASGTSLPRLTGEDIAPWEATPGHIEISLDGYALSEKFHRPWLYVFPVVDLAAIQPGAAENITRLQGILASPETPLSVHDLPGIHFFNAATVFAADIRVVNFQNGAGVRALTVSGQHYASVNNHELFYYFQGLTNNGQYYIIAILPVTHPGLQANSQPGSMPLDASFPPYPDYTTATDVDMDNYYRSMADLLNAAPPDIFAPSLASLDELIESIQVMP